MQQVYIGPGRALDPEKYLIVVVNQIGDGLVHLAGQRRGTGGGSRSPKGRIGDDVRAQHQLLTDKFGIEKLALVVGGSMGRAVRRPSPAPPRNTCMISSSARLCAT